MELINFTKKLRSKKNVMIDGEMEQPQTVKSIPMFMNADEISEQKGDKMLDIAMRHKPELTEGE